MAIGKPNSSNKFKKNKIKFICLREKAELRNEMKLAEISEGHGYVLDNFLGAAEKAQLVLQNHVC